MKIGHQLWTLCFAFQLHACSGSVDAEPVDQGKSVSFDVDHTLQSHQMDDFMGEAKPYATPMLDTEMDEDAAREAAEQAEGQADGQRSDPSNLPIQMEAQFGVPNERQVSTLAQVVPRGELMSMPAVTSGKLFFFQDGRAQSCSANLVGRSDVIVTAGHCVFADGHMSTDMTFVPLYGQSLGAFSATKVHTHSRWTVDQSRNFDWAVVELDEPVTSTGAGRLGYYINHPADPDLKATAYAYPAYAPFDGQELFEVNGAVMMVRQLPHIYMRGNDMTHGASGGAWVKDGKLVGINAWLVRGKDNYVYSPKLESEFCSALNEAGVPC